MFICGFIIYFSAESAVSFFTDEKEIILYGVMYLQITCLMEPIYPIFFISNALIQGMKKPNIVFLFTICRMVILPFVIVWMILNVMEGHYLDIFYGLLIMNWVLGFAMLLIARGLMIKTFNEEKKVFFIF